jgi:uncharacterized protein YegP (UPF0339 family)
LGALKGKWDVPSSNTLKALLEPESEVARQFYESKLALSLEDDDAQDRASKPEYSGSVFGARFEIYRDDHEELRWRLRTDDGRVIAESSAGYPDREACLEAIELVRTLGPEANVDT